MWDPLSLGQANVVADALSRMEWVKPRRVRVLTMTIQSNLTAQILDAQIKALIEENISEEGLIEAHKMRYSVHPRAVNMYLDLKKLY